MSVVGIAIGVAGVATTAFGMASSRSASKKAARAERMAAMFNAGILEEQADLILETGLENAEIILGDTEYMTAQMLYDRDLLETQSEIEVGLIRQRNRRLQGEQLTQAAIAGIEIAGSFSDVAFDSGFQTELDALMTEYDTDIQIYSINEQMKRTKYLGERQAKLTKEQAEDEAHFQRRKAEVMRVTGSNSALSIQSNARANMISNTGGLLMQGAQLYTNIASASNSSTTASTTTAAS
jgi:hypothetical protein